MSKAYDGTPPDGPMEAEALGKICDHLNEPQMAWTPGELGGPATVTLAKPQERMELRLSRADAPIRVMGPGLPAEGIEVPQGKEVVFEAVDQRKSYEPWFWEGEAGGRRVRVTWGPEEAEATELDGGPPLDLWEQKEAWRAACRVALVMAGKIDDGPDLVWRLREQGRCAKPLECGGECHLVPGHEPPCRCEGDDGDGCPA